MLCGFYLANHTHQAIDLLTTYTTLRSQMFISLPRSLPSLAHIVTAMMALFPVPLAAKSIRSPLPRKIKSSPTLPSSLLSLSVRSHIFKKPPQSTQQQPAMSSSSRYLMLDWRSCPLTTEIITRLEKLLRTCDAQGQAGVINSQAKTSVLAEYQGIRMMLRPANGFTVRKPGELQFWRRMFRTAVALANSLGSSESTERFLQYREVSRYPEQGCPSLQHASYLSIDSLAFTI